MAGNLFCQAPMDKEQQKKVKEIHRNITNDHKALLKNQALSVDEKKARVSASRTSRDAQLAVVLTSEQIDAVKAKDPIKWDKVVSDIDKQERSRLKGERDQKLQEVDRHLRDLKSQQDDVKFQMNELKRRQKDLAGQQKTLKTEQKQIKAQYK